ncbi:lipid-binding SYLF domain-containing protein [Thioalkalicoccus limnaeus]|uniref:Lipid-binding SYLF domain-containing protein n=1 Tax=Thioalkalicoccus limnaeus TaxID=120681 RepID=A0ABV4BED6_9GAMM
MSVWVVAMPVGMCASERSMDEAPCSLLVVIRTDPAVSDDTGSHDNPGCHAEVAFNSAFRNDRKEVNMSAILYRMRSVLLVVAVLFPLTLMGSPALAATAEELDRDAAQALQLLYETNPTAATVGEAATAILVFPNTIKAGLVFGGSYGEGVLMKGDTVVDYYNSVSGSWGWQAGAQSYSYVVFLMNDDAVRYLDESHGWEIGVGPTVVVVNEGVAKNLSSSTLKDDAYAFIFDQKGLMASLSIEGTKISPIKR